MKPDRDTMAMNLKAKILKFQREGKDTTRLAEALVKLLQTDQQRLLRTLSNRRFGRRKARQLRKKNGGSELSF